MGTLKLASQHGLWPLWASGDCQALPSPLPPLAVSISDRHLQPGLLPLIEPACEGIGTPVWAPTSFHGPVSQHSTKEPDTVECPFHLCEQSVTETGEAECRAAP